MKNKSMFLSITLLLCAQSAYGMKKISTKFKNLQTGAMTAIAAKVSGLTGLSTTASTLTNAAPAAVTQTATINAVTGTGLNAPMSAHAMQQAIETMTPNLWPAVDQAFTALNSAAQQFAPSMLTATVAPSIGAASLAAGVGLPMATIAAYAGFLVKTVHDVQKEQRLLKQTPENIYQLGAMQDEMLALTAGGNENHSGDNTSHENSSDDEQSSQSWKNKKRYAKITAGLFTAGNVIPRILPEKDKHEPIDEKSFEQLIDFIITPSKENFGEGLEKYMFHVIAPYRNEKDTGNYQKSISLRNTMDRISNDPEDNDSLLLNSSSGNFISAKFESHKRTAQPSKPTLIDLRNNSYTIPHTTPNIDSYPNIVNQMKKTLSEKNDQATKGVFGNHGFEFDDKHNQKDAKRFSPIFELSTKKYGNYTCEVVEGLKNDWQTAQCFPSELFESQRIPMPITPRYKEPTETDRIANLTQN